jgi:ribonuclease HI
MVRVYTDGSCSVNSRKGGWACVVLDNDGLNAAYHGRETNTTNNRMELWAAIQGVRQTIGAVTIVTDSMYVINGATKKYRLNKNLDLWEELFKETQGRDVSWEWVRGHSGDPWNEYADGLAKGETTEVP